MDNTHSSNPTAKRSLKRVIISLFDRQKDYGEIRGKRKGINAIAPSIAMAQQKCTANASMYILLYEPRYREQAKSLVENIEQTLRMNRFTAANQCGAHKADCRVTLIPVEYGNGGVWDISSTSTAINKALNELCVTLGKCNFKLYVNLVNGTAEQRVALAMWAFRTANDQSRTMSVAECFFALPSGFKHTAGTANTIEFSNAANQQGHFGFLQCKFNSQNPSLLTTLTQLEVLLKRVEIGLDDVILLTGPSGAGKTMLAKMCMKFLQCLHPKVKDDNCVSINMSAIPSELFEAELFGYAPGAFTGCLKDGKKGLVEQADQGVLFLDEIGELPLQLQAKLLTFLDTGDYRRVGDTKIRHSRFLLICGTNRNLESEIPNRFRRDLYERINMWHFNVPGLHERPEDIEPAIRRELAIWNDTRKAGVSFSDEALKTLLTHLKSIPLAGNYRELHAIVRRLLTLAHGNIITINEVNQEIHPKKTADAIQPSEQTSPIDYNLADLARLAVAINVCKTAKTAREAGEILFAATKAKNATFNGATYIQRVFEDFGLKVKFKNGKFDTIERK